MKVLKPEVDKINEKYKEKDPLKAQQRKHEFVQKSWGESNGRMFTNALSISYFNCYV